MRYHVDPFSMEYHMTILEYRQFYDFLEKKAIEEAKQMEQSVGGNKLMKSLAAIRDVLNFMFVGKTH